MDIILKIPESQSGFSLIELMIATLLGLMLSFGATSIYLQSTRDAREIENTSILSENGRFALQILTKSIRHAGFFGSTNQADISIDDSLSEVAGDCKGLASTFDFSTAIYVKKISSEGSLDCINDGITNTHLLVIKRVISKPLFDSDPEDENAPKDGIFSFPNLPEERKVYLAGNRESGVLAFGNEIPIYPAGGEARIAWPYQLEIYYIRDLEIPTLSRKVLTWKDSGLTLDNEDLIEGVENLAIKIGIDSNFDGNVDIFENIESSATEWNAIEAIEIYLLLRSAYPDANYVNNKTYSLPTGDFTPSLNQKHYRRLLLQSTISLRNIKLNRRAGV